MTLFQKIEQRLYEVATQDSRCLQNSFYEPQAEDKYWKHVADTYLSMMADLKQMNF